MVFVTKEKSVLSKHFFWNQKDKIEMNLLFWVLKLEFFKTKTMKHVCTFLKKDFMVILFILFWELILISNQRLVTLNKLNSQKPDEKTAWIE